MAPQRNRPDRPSRPAQEHAQLLAARAQRLAAPAPEVLPAAATRRLLVFALAGERYGIEDPYLLEVTRFREITPVPCTPPFILGVVNHRGRVLTVFDLRRLLALPGQGIPRESVLVLAEANRMAFALLAEQVEGFCVIREEMVSSPPGPLRGAHQALLAGVTPDLVTILDVTALVRDPRITVDEVVS